MTGPDDLPDWDLEEQFRAPASIVAVPAAAHRNPRGKRLIVGVPGLGWRADLRGDSTVVQGSRTYVPVLAELEWYRAEVERVEVFAPLVPIERVWVETPADALRDDIRDGLRDGLRDDIADGPSGGIHGGMGSGLSGGMGSGLSGGIDDAGLRDALEDAFAREPQPQRRRDLISRLVSLDAPPVSHPVPARDAASLTGRRVVRISGPDDKAASDRRNLRAVTEPYSSTDGDICVRVATELDWYRWAWTGKMPKTKVAPIHLLWVE